MADRVIENITPILSVASLDASLEHYTGVLGFGLRWRGGSFASVGRDDHSIYLCEDGQGQSGTWLWIGAEDLDALHAEYVAGGAQIIMPPTEFPHAREFRVEDPDGHVLRIGGPPSGEED
jgi:catechol 2,3-dioxygenase-like lactoylglutathione lyase family enzyme